MTAFENARPTLRSSGSFAVIVSRAVARSLLSGSGQAVRVELEVELARRARAREARAQRALDERGLLLARRGPVSSERHRVAEAARVVDADLELGRRRLAAHAGDAHAVGPACVEPDRVEARDRVGVRVRRARRSRRGAAPSPCRPRPARPCPGASSPRTSRRARSRRAGSPGARGPAPRGRRRSCRPSPAARTRGCGRRRPCSRAGPSRRAPSRSARPPGRRRARRRSRAGRRRRRRPRRGRRRCRSAPRYAFAETGAMPSAASARPVSRCVSAWPFCWSSPSRGSRSSPSTCAIFASRPSFAESSRSFAASPAGFEPARVHHDADALLEREAEHVLHLAQEGDGVAADGSRCFPFQRISIVSSAR